MPTPQNNNRVKLNYVHYICISPWIWDILAYCRCLYTLSHSYVHCLLTIVSSDISLIFLSILSHFKVAFILSINVKSTVRHQTASSCPPCQTWPPRSYASRPPPRSAPEVAKHTFRKWGFIVVVFNYRSSTWVPSLVWCPLSSQTWDWTSGPWSPCFWIQREPSSSHLLTLSPS